MEEDFIGGEAITTDRVLDVAHVGHDCAHLLARYFRCSIIAPDLVAVLSRLHNAQAIRVTGHHLVGGWTCSTFEVTLPQVPDDVSALDGAS